MISVKVTFIYNYFISFRDPFKDLPDTFLNLSIEQNPAIFDRRYNVITAFVYAM
ncbi:MAG: hypothetical protein SWH78_11950 [Thermodesulfobacteriota bacterium]|nr:hypothetical protein [Thermodesulfobacteriota bacterium]